MVLHSHLFFKYSYVIILSLLRYSLTEPGEFINAKTAIKYVTAVETGNCTGGTENTLTLMFDHSKWSEFARITMTTANFLTKMIQKSGDGKLTAIDEDMLFALVRNNIRADAVVFGSGIAFEAHVFQNKTRYCPYAHMSGDDTKAFDLSLGYDYFRENVEWYHTLKVKNWSKISIQIDHVNTGNGMARISTPVTQLADGHWTYPYYDCGGGNIWMVTYSLPFFSYNDGLDPPKFRGITTIDIELTNIDINQCDADETSRNHASLDVFRGTHLCQETTYCSPLFGHGFRRGSYVCLCLNGYYFPNTSASIKGFQGIELEKDYDTDHVDSGHRHVCLKCSRGCDVCNDSSPCMIVHGVATRIFIVCVTCVTLTFTVITSYIIHSRRKTQILKSASPIFLQIMCLGSSLICVQMFMGYVEPSNVVCIIQNWLNLIGFFLIYGALLLKTYRISTIFRLVTKRVNMPDRVLLKFMIPMFGLIIAFLSTWTALSPSHAKLITARNGLKYVSCLWDLWNYVAFAGEAVFLLWGVYLSFTVRKAPSHFNESKYITWSIYNAVILGSLIIIITQFVAAPIGPDIVYTTKLVEMVVRVAVTLVLIFVPKFYALYKKTPDVCDTTVTGHVLSTISNALPGPSAGRNVSVQTDFCGFSNKNTV